MGIGPHHDFSIEDGSGFPVEDAFVEFVAEAVGLGVVDEGVIVDVLVAFEHVQAEDMAFAMLVPVLEVDVVADDFALGGQDDGPEDGIAFLLDLKEVDEAAFVGVVLDGVEVEVGVFSDEDFGDVIFEAVPATLVAPDFDDGGL